MSRSKGAAGRDALEYTTVLRHLLEVDAIPRELLARLAHRHQCQVIRPGHTHQLLQHFFSLYLPDTPVLQSSISAMESTEALTK